MTSISKWTEVGSLSETALLIAKKLETPGWFLGRTVAVIREDFGNFEHFTNWIKAINVFVEVPALPFKHLKGWAAIATLSNAMTTSVQSIVLASLSSVLGTLDFCLSIYEQPNITGFTKASTSFLKTTLPSHLTAIGISGTTLCKGMDAEQFARETLGLSFLPNIFSRYAPYRFAFLEASSVSKAILSGRKVVEYCLGMSKDDFDTAMKNGMKLAENVSSAIFAGAMIWGGSDGLKTVASGSAAVLKCAVTFLYPEKKKG